MNRNLLLVTLLGSALALAGCADTETDESVNDPDTLGDAEDDGLDVGDDNDTTNATTTTDTSTNTTTDTGLYGG